MQKQYEKLMRRCITLAKKGAGRVSPNPLVGAVIFDDNFNIISEGFHEKYGFNHAERNAILNAKTDLTGMSIAVNLEPCSHWGKTPPCTDLIIESGIKRVIAGMIDPNPKVCSSGIKKLQDNGIEVITGVLEKECRELNKFFIKNQTEHLPYITIKTAVTLDGKIADAFGTSKWITDEYSRKEVQKLRNSYDAVLTTSNTVIADNPRMTCRLKNSRNPARIILDSNLKTNPNSCIYEENGARVIIITKENFDKLKAKKFPSFVEIIPCPSLHNRLDLNTVMQILYKKGIMSVLTEAGALLTDSLIRRNTADSLIQFVAPKILSDNKALSFCNGTENRKLQDCNNLIITSTKQLKNDIIIFSDFLKA